MQNIDPVLFLGPILYVVLSAGLVAYWSLRRRFAVVVLGFSAAAYFLAIALKVVLQTFTYGWVVANFGAVSVVAGLYFGAQTSFFEVGLAYVVARIAVSRKQIEGRDAEAYGVSLAFWENGILLGALPLFELIVLYLVIANGLMSQSAYQELVNADPSSFLGPSQLLVPIALGVLERVSSFLAHLSWGYLCVLAAYLGKRRYLLAALPMGLADALAPFAGEVPLWVFEATVFLLSLGFFAVAWRITKEDRERGYAKVLTPSASPQTT